MVWSADLKAKIEAEEEGAQFYKPIAIGPKVQKNVIDSLYRAQLMAHLAERKAFSDQKDFNLAKLTDEDIKHLEILAYIDGRMEPTDFKKATPDDFGVEDIPDLKLKTLEMKVPYEKIERSNLREIVSELGELSKTENIVYNFEIIPTDVENNGYFRVIVSPEQKVHAYGAQGEYTVKLTKLRDWKNYTVIELPNGRTLLDWISVGKYTGKSTD